MFPVIDLTNQASLNCIFRFSYNTKINGNRQLLNEKIYKLYRMHSKWSAKIMVHSQKHKTWLSPTQVVCPSHPHWTLRRWRGSSSGVQEGAWCCAAAWHCATREGGGRCRLPDWWTFLQKERGAGFQMSGLRACNHFRNMSAGVHHSVVHKYLPGIFN